MNKSSKFLLAIVLLFITVGTLTLFLSVQVPLFAQDDPLPLPLEEATDVPLSDEKRQEIEANGALLAQTQIFNYNLAYLISQEGTTEDVLSPDYINASNGSEVFYDWESFISASNAHAFQVIIVHKSALDWAEVSWINNAYRTGTLVVGLELDNEQMSLLTGDRCASNYIGDYVNSGNYGILYVYSVIASKEEDLSKIYTANLQECDDEPENVAKHSGTHGAFAFDLDTPEDIDYLNRVLTTTLFSITVEGSQN
jgi:hypothetical protein